MRHTEPVVEYGNFVTGTVAKLYVPNFGLAEDLECFVVEASSLAVFSKELAQFNRAKRHSSKPVRRAAAYENRHNIVI